MPYEPMKRVAEFHDAFGNRVRDDGTAEEWTALVELRRRLVEEECREAAAELARLGRAVARGERGGAARAARVALAKELADLLYVAYGTAELLGIDLPGAFEEVHRSNMSKLGPDGRPVRRADGKVLKGPAYREPDVSPYV